MTARDNLTQIEGYDRVLDEVKTARRYGADYRTMKGEVARVLDLLHPKSLRLRVSEVIEETPSTKTLRMVSETGYLPPFEAGQYINLFAEVAGVRTSRPYSISSAPSETAYYDVTVRAQQGGFVSDHLLSRVKAGDRFEAAGPAGQFRYNPLIHGKELVFIAGGSGITPFMSMIREATDRGLDRAMHLIYGNRVEGDIIFHNELKERAARHKNFTYTPVISEPSKGCVALTGFMSAELMKKVLSGVQGKNFFLCGPGALYDFCMPELGKLGVPENRTRREMFGAPTDITADPGWPRGVKAGTRFSIKVKGKGDVSALAHEPLLVSLERAGFTVPVLCRSGECSMCRVKLLSGKVFQPRGAHVRASDLKYGYVHSCAAYPIEDCEVLL
ncbi:MAG: 2Fe-2S iron-sulfur cluster binding domain-containing protein [Spirochaetes bacterium]|nr:MAG: 2Fe-2S iron-sulfur cluster binding domain-containing protein [Spirochaetota bacterium]